MRTLFATIVTFAWALWFGGLATLLAAVITIFGTTGFDREVQGAFAGPLFPMFERMQLIFAAVTVLGTTAWWLSLRTGLKLVLFVLFAAATVIAVVEATHITPQVTELMASGRRDTPEFEQAHQLSERVYAAGTIVLLIAGLLLPAAIRADAARSRPSETSEETAPE